MKKLKITLVILLISQCFYAQIKPIKKVELGIKKDEIITTTNANCDCGEKFNRLPNYFNVKMNYPVYKRYPNPNLNIICLKQLCVNPLELEVPNLGENDCITYEWYIKSNKIPTAQDPLNYYRSITMTGQGTYKVSISCADIKEMRTHDGTVFIKCNGIVKKGTVLDFNVQDCPINN